MSQFKLAPILLLVSLLGVAQFLTGCGQKGPLYLPSKATQIRFYTINDLQQQRELAVVPDANQAGCHNLLFSRAVYRVAQVGFAFCQIYREKNCAPDSEYSLHWLVTAKPETKKIEITSRITEGAMWFFTGTQEARVSSWSCNLDLN